MNDVYRQRASGFFTAVGSFSSDKDSPAAPQPIAPLRPILLAYTTPSPDSATGNSSSISALLSCSGMAAGLPFTAVPPLSAVLALLAAGLVSGLYFLYRTALPKPIPGIPYNKDAARSVLGDVSAMVTYQSETGQIFPWMVSQSVKLNSPIVQLFLRPFQKPWVIITDFRESQDILLRRTREFDRSDFLGDVFVSLVPEFHISKKSTDEKFKSNRNLIKDLMTPAFLHEESIP